MRYMLMMNVPRAAERTTSIPERNYLTGKAARLTADQRRKNPIPTAVPRVHP
jgi:hypothetical protein